MINHLIQVTEQPEYTEFSSYSCYKMVRSSSPLPNLGCAPKNTEGGEVVVYTAHPEITEYKDTLCSHQGGKGVPLLSHTIDIFSVKLIKLFGYQTVFSILLKIMTSSFISSRESSHARPSAMTPA